MPATAVPGFEFATAPRIVFGAGAVSRLAELCPAHGQRALLVVGGASAERSGLLERLRGLVPVAATSRCPREPTVEEVDAAVAAARSARCDHVVAVGGGSVLDCGKAAAAMIVHPGSLIDYLEGVGTGRQITVPPVPLLAVPTTAGTGSEVTKNAVISGPGFKKSIRHPLLIPRVALVDPELTRGTPRAVAAACGMDALTQLLEAYLSRQASPFTDGLALTGLAEAGRCLERAAADSGEDLAARSGMALASLLSGVCLANAGLGVVHGFAAALSAHRPIPHGVACASVLPHAMRINLAVAQHHGERGEQVLARFARAAEALVGHRFVDPTSAIDAGVATLDRWQRGLGIPQLTALGVSEADLPTLVEGARTASSTRTNPLDLGPAELEAVLRGAL